VATVDSTTGDITALTAVTSQTGTGGSVGDALPYATQGLVRLRTGFFVGGKEIRGRIFIPGLTETDSDIGVPSSFVVGAWNTAVAALIADANSVLLVYSRKHAAGEAVVSGSAWNKWAVLRSRRD
jgi:hypothetical protein